MDQKLYSMIFKRKSFHLFLNVGSEKIKDKTLAEIEQSFVSFDRLYPEIKTAIRIIPASSVNFKRDAQYCILIYSEKKENYLMNAGYIGEQLDLYLVSQNIGTLWYGFGKPDIQTYNGLDFIIMIAIRKVPDNSYFRKEMFQAKRKPIQDIWEGESLGIAEIARFAPSACNTQPWFVKNIGDQLEVYRYKKPGRKGLLTEKSAAYFNRIDIGIFLCFLELCLAKQSLQINRELCNDASDNEYSIVARYSLK